VGGKEEEGEEGKGRREKKKREKGKRKKENKKRKERGGKRELLARFAAAVGHARAATLGRSTTSTRNERKEKGIGRQLVLVSGRWDCRERCRDTGCSDGKYFEAIRAQQRKKF